jgi:ABC-2 type transport system permease protein
MYLLPAAAGAWSESAVSSLVADKANQQTGAIANPRPLSAATTLARRELVRFFRQPQRVFGAVAQPVIFWLVFGAGLSASFRWPGAAEGGPGFRDYFFPGTLVLIVLFTAIFTTISIIEDRREGFLQSVLVAPIPRWSMVLGKVLGGSAIALVEAMLFLAVGWLFGIAAGPLALVAIVAWLALIALALTSVGFVFAWRLDSTQGFHAVMSVLLFPMWLLSGAFFPAPACDVDSTWIDCAVSWLIRVNPLTYGVAGVRRALLADSPHASLAAELPSTALCLTITIGFAVLAFVAACLVAARPAKGDLL